MTSKKIVGALTLLPLFAAVSNLSCGGSSNSSSPTPAASPAAVPSPSPSASPALTWVSVTEVVTFCSSSTCSGGNGFTVNSNGNYLVGDGSAGSGTITGSELTSLSLVAEPVAAQTGLGLSCVPTPPSIGALSFQLTMTYSDQTSQQIIDINSANSCYYGSAALADALQNDVRQLELKYDPQPAPSPSPSAS
jgi:hypothetical protein